MYFYTHQKNTCSQKCAEKLDKMLQSIRMKMQTVVSLDSEFFHLYKETTCLRNY